MSFQLTRHAVERWIERVDPTSDLTTGWIAIHRDLPNASKIPFRYAHVRWGQDRHVPRGLANHKTEYRVSACAVYIIASTRIVTVVGLTSADLATLLVWKMLHVWVDGDEGGEEQGAENHEEL